MEKLSVDVLTNIFIRLPAKQLVQMRCVSKPWNAFLSTESSYLIKSHLNHNINKHNEIVWAFDLKRHYYSEDKPSSHAFPCTAYDLSGSKLNDLGKLPRNFPQSALNKYGGRVIGSVNGLICFYIEYYSSYNNVQGIYIWNPSLSVLMTLPPFSDEPLLALPCSIFCRFFFGFGFDPKTGDYKVVKLIRDNNKSVWLQVEVYSMKKGSWEFIIDSFPSDVNRPYLMFTVDDHDDHLHWLCKVNDIETIVAFDLGVESFSQISLPNSVANIDDCHNELGMLDGKLCVVSHTRYDVGKLEVWVMNEYGVADSWVKSNVLSKLKFEGNIRPFGFTLKNQFLFYSYYQGSLALYDQETDKVTHFGSYISSGHLKVVRYVDSLVWYAAPATNT